MAPAPVACRKLAGEARPEGPVSAGRRRPVAPGSYRRLASDGTPDGAGFDVLPIETWLVERTYWVDLGVYAGAIGDRLDDEDACLRALGLTPWQPPPPVTTTDHFEQPDAAPCFSVTPGECFDTPQGTVLPGTSIPTAPVTP